jgi:hypothetical protein
LKLCVYGIALVSIGPPQTMLGIGADRTQNSITQAALPHVSIDLDQAEQLAHARLHERTVSSVREFSQSKS